MLPARADVVICGAGVAGLSAAWQLAVRHGVRDVVVIDERAPLSLTSDKSTECYRNWWPDRSMVALMNRSIDLLDGWAAATGNAFALNRNGYLFLTATSAGADELLRWAEAAAAGGAGELRDHTADTGGSAFVAPDWDRPTPGPDGADLFLDAAAVRRRFPWAPADARAAIWARRCGWLSAQQLGMFWLEGARGAGARLVDGRVVGVELANGRVAGVRVAAGGVEATIATSAFVDAAGPFVDDVARLVGAAVPVFHELHRKVVFDDPAGAVPREAPLVVWQDAVTLDWSDDERAALADDRQSAWLLDELPPGVHFRPEGGRGARAALLLWNYDLAPTERRFPLPDDPLHVPVVVRGVARALPAFARYLEPGRRPFVDGGYYTKTRENRPLVGPLGPRGAFLLGALSGFGIMASPAAGELLAAHVVGSELPVWASAFALERYADPGYLRSLATLEAGQL
jgi:glycine/D-amino acid oxidase-like deaminating enzyme